MILSLDQFSPLAEGLDHPECVAWGPDGRWYAGGEAGQVYRITPGGEWEQYAETGGQVLGLCLDADANLYACDPKRHAVLKVSPRGEVSVLSVGSAGRPMGSPNGIVFDTRGNLYVSDTGEQDQDNGCVYRVTRAGQAEVVSDELRQGSNGLAIDPAGEYLYVVLTAAGQVARAARGRWARRRRRPAWSAWCPTGWRLTSRAACTSAATRPT